MRVNVIRAYIGSGVGRGKIQKTGLILHLHHTRKKPAKVFFLLSK
jgi:hypothetical protein